MNFNRKILQRISLCGFIAAVAMPTAMATGVTHITPENKDALVAASRPAVIVEVNTGFVSVDKDELQVDIRAFGQGILRFEKDLTLGEDREITVYPKAIVKGPESGGKVVLTNAGQVLVHPYRPDGTDKYVSTLPSALSMIEQSGTSELVAKKSVTLTIAEEGKPFYLYRLMTKKNGYTRVIDGGMIAAMDDTLDGEITGFPGSNPISTNENPVYLIYASANGAITADRLDLYRESDTVNKWQIHRLMQEFVHRGPEVRIMDAPIYLNVSNTGNVEVDDTEYSSSSAVVKEEFTYDGRVYEETTVGTVTTNNGFNDDGKRDKINPFTIATIGDELWDIIPDVKRNGSTLKTALTSSSITLETLRQTLDDFGVVIETQECINSYFDLYHLLILPAGKKKALLLADQEGTKLAEVDSDGTIEYSMHNIEHTDGMLILNDSAGMHTVTLSGNNSYLSKAVFRCGIKFNNLLAAPNIATCCSGASLEACLNIPNSSDLTIVGNFAMKPGTTLRVSGKVRLTDTLPIVEPEE